MGRTYDVSTVERTVRTYEDDFVTLSEFLFDNPETAFQEHKAAAALSDWLEREGFTVQRHAGDIDTAFIATSGTGEPRVAFVAEYDALPEIGHACGHNLIGPGSVIAAATVRKTLLNAGIDAGTVSVIGTPAEEGGGGKVIALEHGLFDNVDAILMFHPADRTLTWRHALASAHIRVTFHGVAAHAAKNPEDGRNALAAMIQLFVGIDGLRQHISPSARIHGVIRNGGAAPNIVPDLTVADFLVRESTQEQALALLERFTDCANAAALATGTSVTLEHTAPLYAERKNNHVMADRLGELLTELGVHLDEMSFANPAGSSDIGNLSLKIPTIHPYLQIAERGTPGHSVAFRDAAGTEDARGATLLMVAALATLGIELITDPALVARSKAEFRERGADIS